MKNRHGFLLLDCLIAMGLITLSLQLSSYQISKYTQFLNQFNQNLKHLTDAHTILLTASTQPVSTENLTLNPVSAQLQHIQFTQNNQLVLEALFQRP